jgi:hypothetical protein
MWVDYGDALKADHPFAHAGVEPSALSLDDADDGDREERVRVLISARPTGRRQRPRRQCRLANTAIGRT